MAKARIASLLWAVYVNAYIHCISGSFFKQHGKLKHTHEKVTQKEQINLLVTTFVDQLIQNLLQLKNKTKVLNIVLDSH